MQVSIYRILAQKLVSSIRKIIEEKIKSLKILQVSPLCLKENSSSILLTGKKIREQSLSVQIPPQTATQHPSRYNVSRIPVSLKGHKTITTSQDDIQVKSRFFIGRVVQRTESKLLTNLHKSMQQQSNKGWNLLTRSKEKVLTKRQVLAVLYQELDVVLSESFPANPNQLTKSLFVRNKLALPRNKRPNCRITNPSANFAD